jgi:hypothetical protein
VPENTISFIQKLIEMKPLHDPPNTNPARPDLHTLMFAPLPRYMSLPAA